MPRGGHERGRKRMCSSQGGGTLAPPDIVTDNRQSFNQYYPGRFCNEKPLNPTAYRYHISDIGSDATRNAPFKEGHIQTFPRSVKNSSHRGSAKVEGICISRFQLGLGVNLHLIIGVRVSESSGASCCRMPEEDI